MKVERVREIRATVRGGHEVRYEQTRHELRVRAWTSYLGVTLRPREWLPIMGLGALFALVSACLLPDAKRAEGHGGSNGSHPDVPRAGVVATRDEDGDEPESQGGRGGGSAMPATGGSDHAGRSGRAGASGVHGSRGGGGAGMPAAGGGGTRMECKRQACSNGDTSYCGKIDDGCGGELDCGQCAAGYECGARSPHLCSITCPLCAEILTCSNGATTSVSGIALTGALMNPDPLYHAVVYIPNIEKGSRLAPLPDGPGCNQCKPLTPDDAVASAITGPDGKFTLQNVPAGSNIPLILKLGSFRMQTTINAEPCVDNALPLGSLRLPRNHTEGDIPLTAIVTGNVDRVQCLMRKIGIEDSEFSLPSGMGRIHMYTANGSSLGDGTPTLADLAGLNQGEGTLSRYTQVLLPCEGAELPKPEAALGNFLEYLNKGGRAFATHYSYTWLFQNGALASTAQWLPTPPPISGGGGAMAEAMPLVANIDTSFQKGADFAQWLQLTGALTNVMPPQITIVESRVDVAGLTPMGGAQRWIYAETPASVQHFTVDMPVGAAPADVCGRVAFSDFHVLNARTTGLVFPAECDNNPLSAQEKVLEFMLFDLAACVGPSAPPPP